MHEEWCGRNQRGGLHLIRILFSLIRLLSKHEAQQAINRMKGMFEVCKEKIRLLCEGYTGQHNVRLPSPEAQHYRM